MNRNLSRLILWAACIGVAQAAPIAVNCPEHLSVSQTATAPDGWEVVPPRQEPSLEGITVYDGPPQNLASQVPVEMVEKGNLAVHRYAVEDGFWLECRYQGAALTIAKPLPPEVKSCHAHYQRQKIGLGPLQRFDCE